MTTAKGLEKHTSIFKPSPVEPDTLAARVLLFDLVIRIPSILPGIPNIRANFFGKRRQVFFKMRF
jgi:hypothetical protein